MLCLKYYIWIKLNYNLREKNCIEFENNYLKKITLAFYNNYLFVD